MKQSLKEELELIRQSIHGLSFLGLMILGSMTVILIFGFPKEQQAIIISGNGLMIMLIVNITSHFLKPKKDSANVSQRSST